MEHDTGLPYCRLCGDSTSEKEEAVNILDGSDVTLRFIILLRLQIKFPVDQHSSLVCPTCVDRLKDFHSFSKKCYSIQIRLAQISHENDTQTTADEKISDEMECEQEYEDTNFCTNSKFQKQEKFEITAENCDNIIIPEPFLSTGNDGSVIVPECIITENNDDDSIYEPFSDDESAHVDENVKNGSTLSKKVPLSKLKDLFLSKIRLKGDHLDSSSDENFRSEWPFSNENPPNEDGNKGKRRGSKLQRRIPPKVSVDDVQCPYCRWYIPKEEFNPEHLSLHVQNLDSEFHKLVMTNNNHFPLEESSMDSFSFHCDECNEDFSKKLCFLEHRNRHAVRREISCHLCSRAFFSRKRLRAHLCSIHLERAYACEQCPYRSKNKPDMAKHRLRVHTDARFQCPLCGKLIAAYPHNLTKHLETHNEVPEHTCDLCPAAYKTKAGLQKHRENKHHPKPVMCSMCGTLCASREKYSKHLIRCRKRIRKMEERITVQ